MRNKYNSLNSFWMKMDTDSVGYCRIRMWNQIEKINENRIRIYPIYYHIKFEYGYGYLYWCLSGYGCQIIRISPIRFPSLLTRNETVFNKCRPKQFFTGSFQRDTLGLVLGSIEAHWCMTKRMRLSKHVKV